MKWLKADLFVFLVCCKFVCGYAQEPPEILEDIASVEEETEEDSTHQSMACYSGRVGFLEGKIGYFLPFSSTLQNVLGSGVDYQLSFTYKIRRQFAIFASGDFFIKSGYSTGDHSPTTLWILPFTLGVKLFYKAYCSSNCFHEVEFYIAAAPRYYLAHARNCASYVDHNNFASGFGGMGGVGAIYSYKHFSLSSFLDVSFASLHSHTSILDVKTPNVQMGGLVAGGSIGYNF